VAEVERVRLALPRINVAWTTAVGVVGVVGADLAVFGARQVRMPIESDYGLVGVLPALFWVGLVLLNLAFCAAVLRAPHPAVTAVLQALLVVVLYGLPAFVISVPRTEVAWRHLGIASALLKSGQINPNVDAYFNWPGFFAGLATLLRVTGVSPEHIALVAPIVNGLLWSVGVAVVVRALTRNAQHMWLAMWLFTLTNWFDQDYLSPQALSFFLYLVAVALVLGRLGAVPGMTLRQATGSHDGRRNALRAWWTGRRPLAEGGRERSVAVWVVVLLTIAIVASHQLSPFMLLAAVAALTLTGRCWSPRLVLIIGLIITVWLTTAASDYLAGHPALSLETLHQTAKATVGDRLGGSPGHVVVASVRTALTLVIYALAGLGWLRSRMRGERDLRPLLLMLVPFVLVPFQPYGGEILMRSALFGLPFAAYYTAALLLPRRSSRVGLRSAPGLVVTTLLLGVALVTGRFGNAEFDMFTRSELQGTQALYRLAPPGADLITLAHPTPWRFRDYFTPHLVLTDLCKPVPVVLSRCFRVMNTRVSQTQAGALVMITRAGESSVRVQRDVTGPGVPAFERALVSDGSARLVYRNKDVRIYRLPSPTQEVPRG
jgi:hypothetical protein